VIHIQTLQGYSTRGCVCMFVKRIELLEAIRSQVWGRVWKGRRAAFMCD
jgi:hypothetical protein